MDKEYLKCVSCGVDESTQTCLPVCHCPTGDFTICHGKISNFQVEIVSLIGRNKRLVEALRKYGSHLVLCRTKLPHDCKAEGCAIKPILCNCGLDQALAEGEDVKEKSLPKM